MKILGNLLMAIAFLAMVASVAGGIATLCGSLAPMWLIALLPGAFLAGLSGKIIQEAA